MRHLMRQSVVTLLLGVVGAGSAQGALTLQQTGGTMDTATNIARAAAGATPFAKDALQPGGQHDIPKLNDGVYGNPSSWIGATDPTFAGIDFAGTTPFNIDRLAFGRDNTNETPYPATPGKPPYRDRTAGSYTFQYTTVTNASASTTATGNPSTGWADFGSLTLTDSAADADRKLYSFPAIQATAIRIVTDSTSVEGATAIDEIEVYQVVPEPSALALVGLAAVAGLRRRGR